MIEHFLVGEPANLAVSISFSPDACPDCFRPPNAGGVHNHGCQLSKRRHCPICWSTHDAGDDCHRDLRGAWCSYDAALAKIVEESPGWTIDTCRELLEHRKHLLREAYAVVALARDPTGRATIRAAALALQ